MNAIRIIFITLFLVMIYQVKAQHVIEIKNGSFEDLEEPGEYTTYTNRIAKSWKSGDYFRSETPVSVHTPEGGLFGVSHGAYDGDVYISMVTRENETWEGISQKLSQPVKMDSSYTITIGLAQSKSMTVAMTNLGMTDYYLKEEVPSKFVIVRVWMDAEYCDQRTNRYGQIVWTSPPIDHTEWKNYTFEFIPNYHHEWIFIEVYYADIEEEDSKPYFGNILIDYISDIVEVKK